MKGRVIFYGRAFYTLYILLCTCNYFFIKKKKMVQKSFLVFQRSRQRHKNISEKLCQLYYIKYYPSMIELINMSTTLHIHIYVLYMSHIIIEEFLGSVGCKEQAHEIPVTSLLPVWRHSFSFPSPQTVLKDLASHLAQWTL